MREETRRRLERAIWLERAKYIGIGLAIVAAIGLAFGYETLDLTVSNKNVGATVTDIEPLVSKTELREWRERHRQARQRPARPRARL